MQVRWGWGVPEGVGRAKEALIAREVVVAVSLAGGDGPARIMG